jgi:hypothetical protein
VYNYSCEIDCNYTAAKSTTTTAVKSTATMAVKSILTSTFFEAVVSFLMGGVQITPTISTLSHLSHNSVISPGFKLWAETFAACLRSKQWIFFPSSKHVQSRETGSLVPNLHSYGEIFLTVPPLTRNVTPVSTPTLKKTTGSPLIIPPTNQATPCNFSLHC